MVHVFKSLSATWHLSRVCLSLQFGSGNATFENTWNSIQQRQTRNAYWSYYRNRGSEYDPLIGLVDSFRVYASENYTCDVIARPVLDLWRIKRATWDRTASSCLKRRWRYVMQCEPCRHIRGVWSTSWTFWPERTVSRHWQVRVWMKGQLPACLPACLALALQLPKYRSLASLEIGCSTELLHPWAARYLVHITRNSYTACRYIDKLSIFSFHPQDNRPVQICGVHRVIFCECAIGRFEPSLHFWQLRLLRWKLRSTNLVYNLYSTCSGSSYKVHSVSYQMNLLCQLCFVATLLYEFFRACIDWRAVTLIFGPHIIVQVSTSDT